MGSSKCIRALWLFIVYEPPPPRPSSCRSAPSPGAMTLYLDLKRHLQMLCDHSKVVLLRCVAGYGVFCLMEEISIWDVFTFWG